jgi:predicted PurR-regulated permease PerM
MSDLGPTLVRPQAQVAAAAKPEPNELATLAVGVVVVAALYLARDVLIPITLAVLLSFVLAPLVSLLRRLYLGRVLAVLLAVLLALSVILSLGGVIGIQVASLAGDIPRYTTTIQAKVDSARSLAFGRLSAAIGRIGRQVERVGRDAAGTPPQVQDSRAAEEPAAKPPLPVTVQQPAPSPLELAERILAPIVGPLSTTGIVFIVAIFILMQQEELRDRLIRLFGSQDLHRTTAAMDDAARRLSKYFLTQLAINALFGAIVGGGLFVLGVPSPVLWGIVAALMRFVPYVGSFIAGALPVALAAAVDPGWGTAAWTLGLFVVTESIMGQVVEPLLYGHSTGLAPISVVVAAIFWTWLWGPIGLILSTPLTLCLVVLGRHIERLEFIDVLLGDRPALTPIESFYQRMLAGDPDEAQDQAELLLRDRPLSSYYDEVALKGLRLAAVDAERGVMSEAQLVRVREAVKQLVEGLDEHEDAQPAPERADDGAAAPPREEQALPRLPPPLPAVVDPEALAPAWRGACPVLCIAGRGPLDECASMLLSQLLVKHGLGARVVPHEEVGRATIGGLDTTDTAMVCISYLDIAGSPSHLRYLLRRLRARLKPGTPVLVGLWPPDDDVLRDSRLRAAIGADFTTSSLHEAVATCLAEAHRVPEAAAAAA